MRSLLALIGLVAFATGISPAAPAFGAANPSATSAGSCGGKTASEVLGAHRRGPIPAPKAILCGSYAGRGSSTMVIALPDRGCKHLGRSWIAFRLEQGRWRQVSAHKGTFTTIAAGPTGKTGRQIRETAPAATGGKCKVGAGEWRLWRWNGKRFVPGRWQKGGGNGGRAERKRLRLSPDITTITGGDTVQYRVKVFEGKRELGDVTNQATLRIEYRGSESICGSRTTTPVTDYCTGLGACDQNTHTCTAISPGDWLVWAHFPTGTRSLQYASAYLQVRPRNNLTITPTAFPNGIFGLLYKQQFKATGAAEPVTWEANRYTKSGYRVPLAFPPGVGETFSGSIGPDTGLMTAAAAWPDGPTKVVIRAWNRRGDSGEETITFETEAPYCSTVCLYAGPQGELSVAWKSCGCTSYFNGAATYDVHATINGIANPYWLARYVKEPFNNGQYWETYAPQFLSQKAGDTVEISVKGRREIGYSPEHGPEYEYTTIGTSNTVVVK
ncbi:MAG TPA: hypothetical protein VFS48_05430 [Solirubrobacterales bacterium]|nr:hypothetical protein [Solirubrobacterales bacterium]